MTAIEALEAPALRETVHVEYDARRPWPLGLPPKEHALAAIIAHGDVANDIEGSHLRVLTSFPEWVFDEARTALVGAGTELAWASASAWRAVVALERIEGAISIDVPGLNALTDEVVAARERLVAYSTFALDGGASSQDLLATLDECISRFVELARVQAEPKPQPVSSGSSVRSSPSRVVSSPSRVRPRPKPPQAAAAPSAMSKSTRQLIGLGAGLLLLFVALFKLAPTSGPHAGPREEWVMQGSLDNGSAKLVPENPQASEAALQRKLSELKHQGITARLVNDEWVLEREAPSAP
ncbi:MAG: hypothetical protein QM817_34215 [Archangium sp.]